ncbi:hypothetical protein CJU89_4157 [Yarrowia sp. B02]|nr:hypothetical protein CJU89_4157 [Yarrowia sp. B02]
METPEIRQQILESCSLEALVALSQTSSVFRSHLAHLDEQLVKPLVLGCVPWMILTPGAGLESWIDCARLIIARRKSRVYEPSKWRPTGSSKYAGDIDKLAKKAKCEYIQGVCVDGDTLPESFEPLFGTRDFAVPSGLVRDKYFRFPEDHSGTTVDMKTMEVVPEDPDKFPFTLPDPADVWLAQDDFIGVRDSTTGLYTFRCVNSYITITSESMFSVRQESERWVVVEEGDALGEGIVHILDKDMAQDNVLVFNSETSVSQHPTRFIAEYTFQLLPGSQGAIRVSHNVIHNKVNLHYIDLARRRWEVFLLELDPSLLRIDHVNSYDPMPDLIIVYRGMLYYNNYGRDLIPLWIDLGQQEKIEQCLGAPSWPPFRWLPYGGTKYAWKALKMQTTPYVDNTEELDISADGRWVTYPTTECRIVCNLLKFKTYIVRDHGWQKDPWRQTKHVRETGCIFVGSGDQPVFYVVNKPYLFAMGWILSRMELNPQQLLIKMWELVYDLFFAGDQELRESFGYTDEDSCHDDQSVKTMQHDLFEYIRPRPMTEAQDEIHEGLKREKNKEEEWDEWSREIRLSGYVQRYYGCYPG